ncbi:MAG TPA: cytochrome c [Vicinamibacterales bacterium]|nr:cytochrome c [Vicinamibacterales bacterium]
MTVTLALGSAVMVRGAAQGAPSTATPTTTLGGVYTQAQADKGEELYYGVCVACHPRGYYTGDNFKKNWSGRPLSDLYDWVKTKMPKSEPGSLTPKQSVEVMAYILQENKMPAGKTAMPTDRAVLRKIRIQLSSK